jgi:hypothetical protein
MSFGLQRRLTFDTFSGSRVFPDHPRIRASEHFINLPRDSQGAHVGRVAGRAEMCADRYSE